MRKLYLQNNDLRDLEPVLGKLVNLRSLGLDRNPISIIPSSIGNLREMVELTLDRLLITTLPHEIWQLWQLKTLSITGCPITSLPDSFSRLGLLKRLKLVGTPLETIPDVVYSLRRLKSLNISENLELREISPKIGALQRLSVLKVKITPLLTTIPCELHLCWRLENLNAHRNDQLRKPVKEGGLGIVPSWHQFNRWLEPNHPRALTPLMKEWERLFRARARLRWTVQYLFLAIECSQSVVEAVFKNYSAILYD
jgi:hypothetical protein